MSENADDPSQTEKQGMGGPLIRSNILCGHLPKRPRLSPEEQTPGSGNPTWWRTTGGVYDKSGKCIRVEKVNDEYCLTESAISDLEEGSLSGLADYLWNSTQLEMPKELRAAIIGLIEGDEGFEYRIYVGKHPSHKRKSRGVQQSIQRGDVFIKAVKAFFNATFVPGKGIRSTKRGIYAAQEVTGLQRTQITKMLDRETISAMRYAAAHPDLGLSPTAFAMGEEFPSDELLAKFARLFPGCYPFEYRLVNGVMTIFPTADGPDESGVSMKSPD